MIKVKHTQIHILAINAIAHTVRHTKGLPVEIDSVPVAIAKLVLIESLPKEASLFRFLNQDTIIRYDKSYGLVKGLGIYLKPILISETEKIEEYEWIYDKFGTLGYDVFQCSFAYPNKGRYYKILALPEHFSPQTLQDIVDRKLNDGDKVYVECERLCFDQVKPRDNKAFEVMWSNSEDYAYFIKLNPSKPAYVGDSHDEAEDKWKNDQHITIHLGAYPKMYTQEEVDQLLDRQACETTAQVLNNVKTAGNAYTKEQMIWAYEQGVIDGCNPDLEDTDGKKWFDENVK